MRTLRHPALAVAAALLSFWLYTGGIPVYGEMISGNVFFSGQEGEREKDAAASDPVAYSYDREKVIVYANKYCINYNSSYNSYKGRGGDHANFVSQCLYAGGIPTSSEWYKHSIAWINVMKQLAYLKNFGSLLNATNANILKGNPVYYDVDGDSTFDQVAICVGRNANGIPIIDSHTPDRYHKAWNDFSFNKAATIQLRDKSDVSAVSTVQSAPVERNKWKKVSGKTYYLGTDGEAVKNRFLKIGGKRYYFNASGVRVTGMFHVNGSLYYANPSNGVLVSGWQKIKGKKYYFSVKTNRAMAGGKYRIGGGWYFFNKNGVRQKGFVNVGESWYYADKKTGKLVTGWQTINKKRYYFNKKTKARVTGWQTIKGKKYYFNSKGVLKKCS